MSIPKLITQVWVGPLPVPHAWTDTWQKFNPDWEYRLYGNDEIFGRKWQNQKMIDHYRRQAEQTAKTGVFITSRGTKFTGEKATLFAWHVIADVVRYELLYELGGYQPGADSECFAPIGDFFDGCGIYTVRTGCLYQESRDRIFSKMAEGKTLDATDIKQLRRLDPFHASPILASIPGHPFLKKTIDALKKIKIKDMGEAVDTTGNCLMARLIKENLEILPDLKFPDFEISAGNPHGSDHSKFCRHHSGTTHNRYSIGRGEKPEGHKPDAPTTKPVPKPVAKPEPVIRPEPPKPVPKDKPLPKGWAPAN
jgi:hypothetical protein